MKAVQLDDSFIKNTDDMFAPKGYFSPVVSEEPAILKYCRVVKEPLRPFVDGPALPNHQLGRP